MSQNGDLDGGERKPGADIRKVEVAQRGVERSEATTVAASQEDQAGSTGEVVREEARGCPSGKVGSDSKHEGRHCPCFPVRHESNNNSLRERSSDRFDFFLILSHLSLIQKWQYCRREIVNLQTWLIPWEFRIKEIESHFGSAVASYFTFLRWLFWINLVMAVILVAFVAIPEVQ